MKYSKIGDVKVSYCAAMKDIAKKIDVFYEENCPAGRKTTYGTGGNADGAFYPENAGKAAVLIEKLKENGVPYVFFGAGSNVLVSDKGFSGAIIYSERLKNISVSGRTIVAESGVTLADFLTTALYSSLGGVEFLSGIPASVGGAIAQNAGCYGKNIGDYVSYVVTAGGIYPRKACGFEYRDSVFKKTKEFIVSACFTLENVEFDESREKCDKFLKLRQKKNPKGRSCGSVFKNDGYFAGKIIEQAGLKGATEGGARVSEKHANFIIADKNATSGDIKRLITRIKTVVKEKTGIDLSEESEYIGEFDEIQ